MRYLLLIIFTILTTLVAHGQNASNNKDNYKKEKNLKASSKSAIYDLSNSMKKSTVSDDEVAAGYEKLAKELASEGKYDKAEEYLLRAKKLYKKLKNKDKVAAVDREIAKMQEAQNKIDQAIVSYESAGRVAAASESYQTYQAINVNDAERLRNTTNPKIQSELIQENLALFDKVADPEEKAVAYQQLAQSAVAQNKPDSAISSLNKALENTKQKSQAVAINKELADIYVQNRNYDKAIEVNKKVLEDVKDNQDIRTEIKQLQALSDTYFQSNRGEEGIESLRKAYDLAMDDGHTLEAKSSARMLAEQYIKRKQPKKALELYDDFLERLEPLIKSDSSLVDAKMFQIHEERISQLERERELKDELIERKNVLNYVLLAFVVLILIFLGFIAKTLYSIKKKNKQIALQSLRREMNPHFIFNSLNSVNQFIAQNNELEANKYLSSYSKLMRNIMENSNKDFIRLSTELEQLKEYLDLEYMRFHDKFTFEIDIDNTLDTDALYVPNMLIQPHLENAIWHGLRYKETKGLLSLTIKPDKDKLIVIVEDNGIGMKRSKELKTKHQRSHNSRGMSNTTERINLLNDLYNCDITIDITDKTGEDKGVIVIFHFPAVFNQIID